MIPRKSASRQSPKTSVRSPSASRIALNGVTTFARTMLAVERLAERLLAARPRAAIAAAPPRPRSARAGSRHAGGCTLPFVWARAAISLWRSTVSAAVASSSQSRRSRIRSDVSSSSSCLRSAEKSKRPASANESCGVSAAGDGRSLPVSSTRREKSSSARSISSGSVGSCWSSTGSTRPVWNSRPFGQLDEPEALAPFDDDVEASVLEPLDHLGHDGERARPGGCRRRRRRRARTERPARGTRRSARGSAARRCGAALARSAATRARAGTGRSRPFEKRRGLHSIGRSLPSTGDAGSLGRPGGGAASGLWNAGLERCAECRANRLELDPVEHVLEEAPHDQPLGLRPREPTRHQVEELLSVDLAERCSVRAPDVVGEDLEARGSSRRAPSSTAAGCGSPGTRSSSARPPRPGSCRARRRWRCRATRP